MDLLATVIILTGVAVASFVVLVLVLFELRQSAEYTREMDAARLARESARQARMDRIMAPGSGRVLLNERIAARAKGRA